MTHFSQLFNMGVPTLGMSKGFTTGTVFFVDSTTGTDDTSHGKNKSTPFATIDYAIGQCTANKGDVIFVMPDHTETVSSAGGITVDIAGISIIGLGNHENRPTITLDTATTAEVSCTASNIHIENLNFVAGVDSLKIMLSFENSYQSVKGCWFQGGATYQYLNAINLTTTKDWYWITDCVFYQSTDPEGTDAADDTGCIYCEDTEHIFIDNCVSYGNFETGFFHNKTTLCADVWITNCKIYTSLSTAVPFTFAANSTGAIISCAGVTPAATDASEAKVYGTLGTKVFLADCYFGNDSVAGGQLGAMGTVCS